MDMSSTFTILLAIGALLIAMGAARGDDAAPPGFPVAVGQRVRLLAPNLDPKPLSGSVVALDERSLTVRTTGRDEPVRVPREAIAKLEVSAGRGSRIGHVTFGALVGGLAGLLAVSRSGGWKYGGETQGVAAIGVLAGGLIGAAIPPAERWTDVTLAGRRVAIVPRPDLGVGLGVALGF
jgi:uncharacterized protein YcfJ